MGLETGTYISDLVVTNPTSNDPKSQGDDHLRLIKSTVKTTFPGVTGAVTPTHTELNYVDGVTSAIQGQLDAKAPLASPALTGVPSAPTASVGTTGGQIATLDFVIATSLSGTLPGQGGNAGKFLSTDGTNGFWEDEINPAVITLTGGVEIVGESGAQVLEDKSIADPFFVDGGDNTKKVQFDMSDITTATTHTATLVDEDVKIFTAKEQYLGKVSASNSATVNVENFFTSEFDDYIIECNDLVHSSGGSQQLSMRVKTTGSYIVTGYTKQRVDGVVSTGGTRFDIWTVDTGSANANMISLWFVKVNDAARPNCWSLRSSQSTNFSASDALRGAQLTAGALTGVQFFLASTNIVSGDFRVYGVRKS